MRQSVENSQGDSASGSATTYRTARAARAAEVMRIGSTATETILYNCIRENFSELRWLEAEVRRLRNAVEAPAS